MQPPGYTIRLAEPSDVPALPEIERTASRQFLNQGVRAEALDYITPVSEFEAACGRGRLWVAADAIGRPIGFALVELLDGAPHLEEIDVLPDHQGRGLGRALIATLRDWARTEGYSGVTLTTYRDVPWNAPFYARLGFRALEPAEIPPALREIVAEEARHGLDPARRVVMRLALKTP